jgi:hypothetical protein
VWRPGREDRPRRAALTSLAVRKCKRDQESFLLEASGIVQGNSTCLACARPGSNAQHTFLKKEKKKRSRAFVFPGKGRDQSLGVVGAPSW